MERIKIGGNFRYLISINIIYFAAVITYYYVNQIRMIEMIKLIFAAVALDSRCINMIGSFNCGIECVKLISQYVSCRVRFEKRFRQIIIIIIAMD